MNVERLLAHYGVIQNPFNAEEARFDPVFDRLLQEANQHHPDFPKVMGRIDRPSAAVVFGEKGSGKTAIRLLMERKVVEHNQQHADRRALLVAYDDLNPVLDRVIQRRRRDVSPLRRHKVAIEKLLEDFRLEEHQDAILSLAVTRLVTSLLEDEVGIRDLAPMPEDLWRRVARMPRRQRVDLAVLAVLFDQPRSGDAGSRLQRLMGKLRLGWHWPRRLMRFSAMVLTILAAGVAAAMLASDLIRGAGQQGLPGELLLAGGLCAVGALVLWGLWCKDQLAVWSLARQVARETPALAATTGELRRRLLMLGAADRADQPWPAPGADDSKASRYMLTAKLVEVLRPLGYTGVIVLVDRVDEPTLVAGQADRMRALLWPMFDNKFLQQEGIGVKLLLPLDLRHLLHRESALFFQEARLDKQNLIDRLTWSGATLYDLCSARLRACQRRDAEPVYLTDLFEPEVSREMLVDALDQMHQPRDAFKFLYAVIQEHCRLVPEDEAKFQIPRLTLENVRRDQSQRVQELYRGLTPA